LAVDWFIGDAGLDKAAAVHFFRGRISMVLKRAVAKLFDRFTGRSSQDAAAQSPFDAEIAYWDRELSLQGDFASLVVARLDPEKMIDTCPALFEKYRAKISRTGAKVLDVGSGPLSLLAHGHYRKLYELDCVDPLADEYRKLLAKYGYRIEYRLVQCPGETLSKVFAENDYDIVWMHNALDHSQNPEIVVREMAKVLRPGGYLCIAGWANEGTAEGFLGLHQNDLRLIDGRLHLATKADRTPKQIDALDCLTVIESHQYKPEEEPKEWMHIVYEKRQDA
jgi:SAM-dependent methyltransferase